MKDLEQTLIRLGLSQYLTKFIEEGFEAWDTVLDITESDLIALNKLQREIANARGVEHLSPVPTGPTSVDDAEDDLDEKSSSSRADAKYAGASFAKRKYRRHPKPDENAPERAPSAYVIFSNKIREDLKMQNLSFTEIAKRVGENWQDLSPEGKEPYESQAATVKERYNAEMAEYKTTASFKEYAQYLTDFKTRNATSDTDGKRAKIEKESKESSASAGSPHESTITNPGEIRRKRVDSNSSSGVYYSMDIHQCRYGAKTNLFGFDGPTSPPVPLFQPEAGAKSVTQALPSGSVEYERNIDCTSDSSFRPQLPRLLPPKTEETRPTLDGFVAIAPDTTLLHGHGNSQSATRRSNNSTVPASLICSEESMSSSNSAESVTYTPVTPTEETRMQRLFLPQPVYPPVSTEPQAYSMASRSTRHGPSLSTDHFQERHFKDLSLVTGTIKPQCTPCSPPHPVTDARGFAHGRYSHQQSEQRIRELHDVADREARMAILNKDNSSELYRDQPIDALSVLAYAGKFVDRNAQKPP
ncbi:hypothetical protein MMC06_003082 [Schaereria dolodes]|nr:hypothetical protein [Schaereria dolodes]